MKNLIATATLLTVGTVFAHAQLLNIESARDATYNMTGEAVLGESSTDYWNQAPNDDVYTNSGKQTYGESSGLEYADTSAATGVTVTYNNVDSFYSGDYAPYAGASNVFGSYIRLNPSQHTEFGGTEPNPSFEFSGLNPDDTYTLVVYGNDEASNGGGRSFEITTDGQSEFLNLVSTAGYASVGGSPTDGIATYSGNYLEFQGLAASGGNLTFDILGLTNSNEVDITGFQLEDTGVIPEPSTWALLLGGLAALVFIRRRATA